MSSGHKLRCQDFIGEDIVLYVHQNYLMPQSDRQNQRCYRNAEGTLSWNQCGLRQSFCSMLNVMVNTGSTVPCVNRSCKYSTPAESLCTVSFIKCCWCCITF